MTKNNIDMNTAMPWVNCPYTFTRLSHFYWGKSHRNLWFADYIGGKQILSCHQWDSCTLYLDKLVARLPADKLIKTCCILPDGEQYKTSKALIVFMISWWKITLTVTVRWLPLVVASLVIWWVLRQQVYARCEFYPNSHNVVIASGF